MKIKLISALTTTPGHRLRRAVLALALALCAIPLAASAAAAASFTWSGATPLGSGASNWLNGANWAGTAPSGTVETLTFPTLTSGACTAKPPTDTCYMSNNNVSGLSVNAISIDDTAPYSLTGNAITLGAGGITATAPSACCSSYHPGLDLPIALGAAQTWSIDGGGNGGEAGLETREPVTGTTDALDLELGHQALVRLTGDDEVGAVTIAGKEPTAGVVNGFVVVGYPGAPGSLNATDGNPVTVSDAVLMGSDGTFGPLSSSGGTIDVGQGGSPVGTFTVNGGVTLDATSGLQFVIAGSGTTAGTDYSQLRASGTVNLAGARLSLSAVNNGGCVTLTAGTTYTLVSTTGSLLGTFAGVPNGAKTGIGTPSPCGPSSLKAQINYTANTVTATLVSASSSPTNTSLSAIPASPVTNQAVTLTATVTPNAPTPSGTVSFQNHGTPIAGCESRPVALAGSSYTATCQTTFTAASSPEALTAVFTAAGGSGLQGSTSTTESLTVSQNSEEVGRKQHEEAEAKERQEARERQEANERQQAKEAEARKGEEAAANRKHEEEATAAAAKKHQEEEAAAKKKQEEERAKSKPPTRAQLLAKALKSCKQQPKKKRAQCEATARKKYASKAKGKKGKTKK